jgi:hypothetical protein
MPRLLASMTTVLAMALCGAYTPIIAADPMQACVVAPPAKGKSRQRVDLKAFMLVATELEMQGQRNFDLRYEPPNSECLVENVGLEGGEVQVVYNPWQKGEQTLLYRFAGVGEDSREVLVLYNGRVGLLLKGGDAFHVSEARHGTVSFYAMYKEEPTYQVVKALAAEIFKGDAKPLLAVRWPEGDGEASIVEVSAKLKR